MINKCATTKSYSRRHLSLAINKIWTVWWEAWGPGPLPPVKSGPALGSPPLSPSYRIYGWMTLTKMWVPICLYCSNCTKFCQLILRNIIKFVATRCQILSLKCTKFDFGWSCRADATKALKLGYHQIKSALEQISDDVEEKACVRWEAEGLVARLNQLETGIYTVFWNDILQRNDATNRSLQSTKLDLNTAVTSITSLKDFVSSKRDFFEGYERQG